MLCVDFEGVCVDLFVVVDWVVVFGIVVVGM